MMNLTTNEIYEVCGGDRDCYLMDLNNPGESLGAFKFDYGDEKDAALVEAILKVDGNDDFKVECEAIANIQPVAFFE